MYMPERLEQYMSDCSSPDMLVCNLDGSELRTGDKT